MEERSLRQIAREKDQEIRVEGITKLPSKMYLTKTIARKPNHLYKR